MTVKVIRKVFSAIIRSETQIQSQSFQVLEWGQTIQCEIRSSSCQLGGEGTEANYLTEI